jgi:argininosuccinate lyase
LADYLVKKGIPFREAHFIVGRAVAMAEELNMDLSELDTAKLKSLNENIKDDVKDVLNLTNSMNSRNSLGATSKKATKSQIDFFQKWIEG